MKIHFFGDLYGHRSRTERHLVALGFRRPTSTRAQWIHPEGDKAIFCGDYADGDDGNLATIELVADVVGSGCGRAILGNHDFNILAILREDPQQPGSHLRKRTADNLRQCAGTLREIEAQPERGERALAFLRSLPLWIDEPSYRVAHAHWDANAIAILKRHCDESGGLTEDGFVAASRRDGETGAARTLIQCGPEEACEPFTDRRGQTRRKVRTPWWDALEDDHDPRPLFFGHYAMPAPLAPFNGKHVCVDAGVAHGGRIGAYSHEFGEPIHAKRFTYG